MTYQTLLCDKRDGISTVTVNRPEKLNALNRTVLEELNDCFLALQSDREVRAVILTGAGEKAFVAGADINELACTLRVASENARFGQPEVKLGIIPGYAGTQRLGRLVGKGRALEMILTGEQVTAQEAYRIGLVNQVVPAKELAAAARGLAEKMTANGPIAVQFALEAVNRGMEMTLKEGELLEATLFGLLCVTADMKEGTRAFLEKRPAKFEGK
ncbi:MAG: hypothetical protein DMG23_12235 [Acidobacteria bacterium]|nr:MAG: hypothetical protein DMG23_12235 [Acidobacteriota bacterium]